MIDMPPATRRRALTWLCAVVLAACTAATFWPVTSHGFLNWDDQAAVAYNPDYRDFTPGKLTRYWTTLSAGLYVPVTYTVWGALAHIAQRGDAPPTPPTTATTAAAGTEAGATRPSHLDPRPFHVFNLGVHVANGLLVFAVLLTLTRRRLPAAIGAGLFALHPMQAEPVSWISSMYTLLSTFFGLLAVWQYVLYAMLRRDDAGDAVAAARPVSGTACEAGPVASVEPATSPRRGRWLFAGATVAFALAMLTKPFGVVVPLVAGTIDWLIVGRPLRQVVRPMALWLALALPVIYANRAAQPSAQVFRPAPPQRLLIAADTLLFYLGKVVWPAGLVPDYGRTPRSVLARPQVYAAWLVPAGLAAACWWQRRRRPWLLAGLAIFVAAAAPALGLVPFDFQIYSTVADRYAYFSLFGAALVAAFALAREGSRRAQWVAAVCAAVVCLVLAVRANAQAQRWRDSHTLFTYTLRVNPRSLAAHRVFGFLAAREGRPDEALRHYEAALRTEPRDPIILYNLGNLHLRAGRPELAAQHYQRALEVNPAMIGPRLNLAGLLASNGYVEEAVAHYQFLLDRDPDYAPARAGIEQARRQGGGGGGSPARPPGSAPGR